MQAGLAFILALTSPSLAAPYTGNRAPIGPLQPTYQSSDFAYAIPNTSLTLHLDIQGDNLTDTEINTVLDQAATLANSHAPTGNVPTAGLRASNQPGALFQLVAESPPFPVTWAVALDVVRGLRTVEVEGGLRKSTTFAVVRKQEGAGMVRLGQAEDIWARGHILRSKMVAAGYASS